MNLPVSFLHSILAFLEFFHMNNISSRVIQNYHSSLKNFARTRGWDTSAFNHQLVSDYVRSIILNSAFSPIAKGSFDLKTLAAIIQSYDLLSEPGTHLLQSSFLFALFGFSRMSNIASRSKQTFDNHKHLLCQDVIFAQHFKIAEAIILSRFPFCPITLHVLLKL